MARLLRRMGQPWSARGSNLTPKQRTERVPESVHQLLERLYGDRVDRVSKALARRLQAATVACRQQQPGRSQASPEALLITYGNSLHHEAEPPLQTLHRFLDAHLKGRVGAVHVLPFFPYSSDDGFAVIDFYAVNPELGSWDDIKCLARDWTLMVDLVINHVSRESLWFVDYINNAAPGRNFFISVDPDTDLSAVVRPRNSPLLVPIHTYRGRRHLWATFSEDQIDLDFAEPRVLLAMLDVLAFYLQQGARMVRLDAIAYLWKEVGSSCIHHPRTHDVVRLLRWFVDAVCDPEQDPVLLVSETNVPHEENVSYFGTGDEAHQVYQFSLAPLLLQGLLRGDASTLTRWGIALAPPPAGCSFLNFTASHDGIGLRPAEGWLASDEIQALVDLVHHYGGFVSMRTLADGSEQPYELNIALFDALQGTFHGPDCWQVERFLCSQVVMLSLQGVPAIYLHSLLATGNDLDRVEQTGRTRSINRGQWAFDALEQQLADTTSARARVFHRYLELLDIRARLPALRSRARQRFLQLDPRLLALVRGTGAEELGVLANFSDQPVRVSGDVLTRAWRDGGVLDHLSGLHLELAEGAELAPYQCAWLQPLA